MNELWAVALLVGYTFATKVVLGKFAEARRDGWLKTWQAAGMSVFFTLVMMLLSAIVILVAWPRLALWVGYWSN